MHAHNSDAQPPIKVLEVSASARSDESVSRALTQDIIDRLDTGFGKIELTRRDLSDGIRFVDEDWITANFTPDEERTEKHRAALAESDRLVGELQQADVIVIGTPMYNFGVPAALKAWIDMIARARLTFRYTEDGPEGLLTGKKAYVVIASGGVAIDSPADFATPYLRQVLGFVGITDVEFIAAEKLNNLAAQSIDTARARIAELINVAQALREPGKTAARLPQKPDPVAT